jgi:hypothetical protein
MEHLSLGMEQQNQLQWRRDKVQELCSKGYSQREISQTLQVGLATVNRDLSYLRQQAKENIKKYIDERLPEEYEKCLLGLTAILREAWNTAQNSEDRREKMQALYLAKDCYEKKLDLLTNAIVVDDAIYGLDVEILTAVLVDFPVWGANCGKMSSALKKNYDYSSNSCIFLDKFATPLPEHFVNQSNELIKNALPTYEKEMRRAARLILDYELSFWNTIYKYSL